jgi:basic amino acid/polyamine antiporter, APA family
MGNPLFAKKSLQQLVSEAEQSGEHSLKKTLGPFQLTALGVGAVIGAGIFVFSGLGAHYAGPGLMLSFPGWAVPSPLCATPNLPP